MPDSQHVIFGTGPLGQAVAAELSAQGKPVRMVNRRGQPTRDFEGIETVSGDLTDLDSCARAAEGANVIYHCAVTPYTEWAETLPSLMNGAIHAAAAAGARLVYGDNLYAYAPTAEPITERTPERPQTRKGRVRAAVAATLRTAHEDGRVEAVIGRGSDFYGPGVLNSAVGSEVFGRLAEGKRPRILGDPTQLHSFTFVEDFGRALVLLGERSEAIGETWHVPNASPVSAREFAERAVSAMGQTATVSSTPSWLVKAIGLFNPTMREVGEMLYEWEHAFVVDHSKFAQAFGDTFGPATPLDEAIKKTAASFRSTLPL